MTASEIDGTYGIPRDATSLDNEIQQVLHGVGKRMISKAIRHNYTQKYSHRVIKWVNK